LNAEVVDFFGAGLRPLRISCEIVGIRSTRISSGGKNEKAPQKARFYPSEEPDSGQFSGNLGNYSTICSGMQRVNCHLNLVRKTSVTPFWHNLRVNDDFLLELPGSFL
jgi:hypothetical protein